MLAVLLAGPFMAQADATIANLATPAIHTNLGASATELELVVGGYLIAYAMLLITGARLGQTHGYRRMFMAGMGIFTVASLGAGLAPTPLILIVARVIQGLGAALMFPQALTGIQLNFAGPARTWAIGYYAIAASAGAVAGQLFGGLLISANLFGSDWRPIFLINVPIGVAAIGAAARFLPGDTHRTTRRLDLIGVGALSVAVLLLVLPLTLGRSAGWPAWTWLCLAASLPALGGFLASQRHLAATGGAPLINLHVLIRRPVSFALLALALATGTYYALLFTLAQYLQQGLGDSPLISGLMLVPWVAAFGAAGQLVRLLPARAAVLMPTAGCLLLTGAYLAISITLFTGNHDQTLLIVLLGGGGLGLGPPVQCPHRPPHERRSSRLRSRHQRGHHHRDANRRRDRHRWLRHPLHQSRQSAQCDPQLRHYHCGLYRHRRGRNHRCPHRDPAQRGSQPARSGGLMSRRGG